MNTKCQMYKTSHYGLPPLSLANYRSVISMSLFYFCSLQLTPRTTLCVCQLISVWTYFDRYSQFPFSSWYYSVNELVHLCNAESENHIKMEDSVSTISRYIHHIRNIWLTIKKKNKIHVRFIIVKLLTIIWFIQGLLNNNFGCTKDISLSFKALKIFWLQSPEWQFTNSWLIKKMLVFFVNAIRADTLSTLPASGLFDNSKEKIRMRAANRIILSPRFSTSTDSLLIK